MAVDQQRSSAAQASGFGWLYAILSVMGWVFILFGIGMGLTPHAADGNLSQAIQLWSLAGGLFMGLTCLSIAAIMRVMTRGH